MSSRRLSEVDRRAFLGKSALTMLAGTCFSSVARVRAALAIVAEQGKPLFTEENVNAFIQAARSGRVAGGAEGVKGRAQSDVRALVREHFALSPEQEKKIFTSRYKLHLPTEAELRAELTREVKELTNQ